MGSNIVPILIFFRIFFSSTVGNGSRTVPWIYFCFYIKSNMGSNLGSDIGSNPQAFVIRFSPPRFMSILRHVLGPPGPRAANRKTGISKITRRAKIKQARSLANLRVPSKGWGKYMYTVNKTQRGQLNARDRAKPIRNLQS